MLIGDLNLMMDQEACIRAQITNPKSRRAKKMPNIAEMAVARAKAKKAAAKTTTAVKSSKKTAVKKNGKKKTGEKKSGTPRANSKTAQILELLKSGHTKESIRKKFDMEREADVQWYVAKLKASGRLPASFKAKE